jgi:GT2 family glycosyltransferase
MKKLSICVPTWNSLHYLKLLKGSLNRNTTIPYELIVHDNGSTDGTVDWLYDNDIHFTRTLINKGFAGVNHALMAAETPYVMIVNSDMYALPGWDEEIFKQIKVFELNKIDRFTISSCLVEPGYNPEYTTGLFGNDYSSFDEEGLLNDFRTNRQKYFKPNTVQYSHPILAPRFMYEEIGYLDEEFFPGWSLDHWMPWAMHRKGCNNSVMLGNSRFYHFISKTFTQLPNDVKSQDGQDLFLKKTGITVEQFRTSLNLKTPYRMRRQ